MPPLKSKPNAPRSSTWDRIKRPDLVTKMIFAACVVYATCSAGFMALLYILLRWLAFPNLPWSGTFLAALLGALLGFWLAWITVLRVLQAALKLPDEPHA